MAAAAAAAPRILLDSTKIELLEQDEDNDGFMRCSSMGFDESGHPVHGQKVIAVEAHGKANAKPVAADESPPVKSKQPTVVEEAAVAPRHASIKNASSPSEKNLTNALAMDVESMPQDSLPLVNWALETLSRQIHEMRDVPLDSLALVGWALAQRSSRRQLMNLIDDKRCVPYRFTEGPLGLRLKIDSAEGVVEAAYIESVVEGGAAHELGVPVGAKLVRINDVSIAGVEEASVRSFALQRPVTLFLAPPRL